MGDPFRLRCAGDVVEADRDQHAVQRLSHTGALEQVEKSLPADAIHRGIGILGGVAAGSVDQHGLVGEPPVAQSGAADAGDGVLSHFGGQREAQSGIQQRGRFACARRPDDGVPGLLVEVAALAMGAFSAASALWSACRAGPPLPRPWRRRQCRRLGSVRPAVRAASRRRFSRSSSRFTPAHTTNISKNDDQPDEPAFQPRKQRSEEPDQDRKQCRADEAQKPPRQQKSKDVAHSSLLLASARRGRIISFPRPCRGDMIKRCSPKSAVRAADRGTLGTGSLHHHPEHRCDGTRCAADHGFGRA